jgi:hypothetical protein
VRGPRRSLDRIGRGEPWDIFARPYDPKRPHDRRSGRTVERDLDAEALAVRHQIDESRLMSQDTLLDLLIKVM